MITIALADDDALVRRTLTELLDAQDGITVAWAARDGQEALDKVRDPDQPRLQALLLDVQMPGLDGISVAETLHAESPEIAVLILTTFMADPIVDRAMAAGVRGFIAKEDPIASIAGAIQQAVDGNMVLSPTSSAILGQRLSGPTAPGGAPPSPTCSPWPWSTGSRSRLGRWRSSHSWSRHCPTSRSPVVSASARPRSRPMSPPSSPSSASRTACLPPSTPCATRWSEVCTVPGRR